MVDLTRRSLSNFPRQWSPKTVPTWPVVIDPNHPLSQGLIAMWVPGSPFGFTDLVGNVRAMLPNAASTIVPSGVGPGLASSAATQGMSSNGTVTLPSPFYAAGANFAISAYSSHTSVNAGGTTDTEVLGIGGSGGYGQTWFAMMLSTTGGWFIWFNNAASSFVPSPQVHPDLGLNSTAFVFSSSAGQNVTFYKQGAAVQSATTTQNIGFGAAPIAKIDIGLNPSQASYMNATILGLCLYNTGTTQLSAQNVAWLAAEPFAMLVPVVQGRQYYVTAPPSTTTPTNQRSVMPVVTPGGMIVAAGGGALLRNPRIKRRRLLRWWE